MTPDEMRVKSRELYDDAKKRLTAAALGVAIETQVAVTVDQTVATVMAVLADMQESLNPDAKAQKAKQVLAEFAAKNDALRKAAAKGYKDNDWTEFNRLVDAGDAVDGGK